MGCALITPRSARASPGSIRSAGGAAGPTVSPSGLGHRWRACSARAATPRTSTRPGTDSRFTEPPWPRRSGARSSRPEARCGLAPLWRRSPRQKRWKTRSWSSGRCRALVVHRHPHYGPVPAAGAGHGRPAGARRTALASRLASAWRRATRSPTPADPRASPHAGELARLGRRLELGGGVGDDGGRIDDRSTSRTGALAGVGEQVVDEPRHALGRGTPTTCSGVAQLVGDRRRGRPARRRGSCGSRRAGCAARGRPPG